jgi:hypothetical protein
MTSKNTGIFQHFLAGMVGCLLTLIATALILYLFFDTTLIDAKSAIEKGQCLKADKIGICFYDENWDSETYLAVISGFYTTIITLLIALLSIVGVFAFVVIRANAIGHADEQIKMEVERFVETGQMKEIFHEKFSTTVEDMTREHITGTKGRMDAIEAALEEVGISVGGKLTGKGVDGEE